MKDAIIVNTGELLLQWANDHFLSVKHFANHNLSPSSSNEKPTSRYSIPFFFNANSDYRMHCIPTCCSGSNPPKYPPFSYEESQALAQGE
jgi:isopenicillin N synthase-like dioxygenase